MKAQNNVTVQDQDGNSSKPLLCDGLLDKIMGVKILRPVTIPLFAIVGFAYIIIDYIFNIEE
jgi:hypothetical protein